MVESVGRVFVAAPLPDGARIALADRLRGLEIPGRRVPPENWHLTLRFLGSVESTRYERFLGAVDQAELGSRFRVALSGLGAFPNPRRATVTWIGVTRGADRLHDLAEIAEEAAVTAGLPPEDRPFRPHLTLSRVRPQQDATSLVATGSEIGVDWRCDSVVVYRSHTGRDGARYEALETFSLTR